MKRERFTLRFGIGVSALLLLPTLQPQAATFNLRADTTQITMPDGRQVAMWGFADDTALGDNNGQVTVPGPVLEVPAGESLTIRLKNNLKTANTGTQYPNPVSIIIPGQANPGDPVRFGPTPYPQYEGRIRSLTKETPPDNSTAVEYTWSNLKPGTYLYHSGTHMQCHVQMGLYGVIKVYAAGNRPYENVNVDNEVTLLYSEIDPAYHDAVSTGQSGPGTQMSSAIHYSPKYFLINGKPFGAGDAPVAAGQVGETTLLRLLNAGLESHAPMLQGLNMTLIAEDGKPSPYPRQTYVTLLAAGKTLDALITSPQPGIFPLMDRRLYLANAGTGGGGMLCKLAIGSVATQTPPESAPDSYAMDENTVLNVAAPGVLGNDTGNGMSAVAVAPAAHGNAVLNGNGGFAYTPTSNWWGTDQFTYKAVSSGGESTPTTVTITVNHVNRPPVAAADSAATHQATSATISVLQNDSDPDGDTLVVGNVTVPAHGSAVKNPDGTIRYTPNAAFTGTDQFFYTAFDGVSHSAQTTVTVTVSNIAPVATNDTTSTRRGVSIKIDILANDYDPDGQIVPSTLAVASPNRGGTTSVNPDWTVTYTPASTFTGTETFTYRVRDENGLLSNRATVSIRVTNLAPIATNDTTSTRYGSSVVLNILANDYDPDGLIVPSTLAVAAPNRGGTVSVNPNWTVTYTPPSPTFVGTETFTYRVKDDSGLLSNVARVSITLTNQPPTVASDTATVVRGSSVIINVLANDSDADGTINPSTVVISGSPTRGTAVVNPNGTVTYTTTNATWTGVDTFRYRVKDNAGALSVQSVVRVTVTR